MLCVNEVEACALAGTETFEADAVLTLLHEKYPQTRLLLTAGSAGSYYLDAERRLFVPCEKVQAVDTTAAGDTYSGYFLAVSYTHLDVYKRQHLYGTQRKCVI